MEIYQAFKEAIYSKLYKISPRLYICEIFFKQRAKWVILLPGRVLKPETIALQSKSEFSFKVPFCCLKPKKDKQLIDNVAYRSLLGNKCIWKNLRKTRDLFFYHYFILYKCESLTVQIVNKKDKSIVYFVILLNWNSAVIDISH